MKFITRAFILFCIAVTISTYSFFLLIRRNRGFKSFRKTPRKQKASRVYSPFRQLLYKKIDSKNKCLNKPREPLLNISHSFAMWGSQAYWKNYVSDEFYETFHVFLHKQLNWKIYKHGMKVDILLFVEAYSAVCSNFHSLKKNNLVGTIVLFVDDLHWVNKKMRQQKLKAFQLPGVVIMSTYANQAAQLYPEIDTSKWIWMPHAASRRFIQPSINTTATLQSILLTGATSSMWYPHRAKAAKLGGESGLVTQILHPGYQKSTEKEQKQFVMRMVHFGMGLTDGSSLHYALAKIFEIPATGQLLLLNDEMEAHMRNLCFVPGVHYIGYNENNMKNIKDYHGKI